ncbi:MAG TPA: hypothetical protein VGF52_00830 [Tepidisphaeraceae bacterium]|jgi:hypothetical protein
MPRTMADTRFRRFMMQAIMWLVLGATIGGAALVDRFKMNHLSVPLDKPVTVGDVTLSLPRGWDTMDASDNPQVLIAVGDPDSNDKLELRRQRVGGIGRVIDYLSIGDFQASLRLEIFQQNGQSEIDLIASRPMPDGPPLTIMLISDSAPDPQLLQSEIDLIKRVAATVIIHQSGETTQT